MMCAKELVHAYDMPLSLQWGATALMKASEEGKVECVKVLLHAGVQVNVQNNVSAVLIKLQETKLYLGRCTQALQLMRKRRNSNNLY